MVIVVQLVTLVPIYLIWGRRLHATAEDRQRVMEFNEKEAIEDSRLLVTCLVVIAAVVAGFISAKALHLEAATIALFGAAVLLLLVNLGRSADEQSQHVLATFKEVEWITLFVFIGLFIVVHGVDSTGALKILAEKMLDVTGGQLGATAMAILWASAILSAIIDNIPFVATMIPLIHAMAPSFGGPDGVLPLWWALSLGACLGGSGTLVGASANLVVAGFAERAGQPIRFLKYTLMAFPLMLLSIVICTLYLQWRYL